MATHHQIWKNGQDNSSKISKPQRSRKHKKFKAVATESDGAWVVQWKKNKLKQANQRPLNDDVQEVPRAVMAIQKWKENPPKRTRKKKKTKAENLKDSHLTEMEQGMTRPLKPVPKFQQGKNESDDAFMNRVERETQRVIQKSQFEDKYKIDVDNLHRSGQSINNKKKGKKKQRELNSRLKLKKEKKKEKVVEKRKENEKDFSTFKDHVEFGEVVMEPPSLTSKPRKAEKTDGKTKPGKKSLLLKEIMTQNSATSSQRQLGQTLKRKHMSMAQQRISDKERDKAIQLYREIKLSKIKT